MSEVKGLLWDCPKTGQRYMDCLNANYADVFKMAWPESSFAVKSVFQGMSDALRGDYLEALVGWHYIRTVENDEQIHPSAEDVILMIEKASLAQWCVSNGRHS